MLIVTDLKDGRGRMVLSSLDGMAIGEFAAADLLDLAKKINEHFSTGT